MHSVTYSLHSEHIAPIWHTFVTSGQLSEEETAVLNPTVLHSWQRCSPRLNPHGHPRLTRLKKPLLKNLLQTQERLITTAVPYLEEVDQLAGDIGCAFLLTDRAGCILLMSGEPSRIAMIKELGLRPGIYGSEEQLGTNAIGIALKTARPVQVWGPEHYFAVYHPLITIAAPIHDSDGRILGILGMIGQAATTNSQVLALATSVAWAISNQIQSDHFRAKANHHLTEIQALLETVNEGIVMWDREERIRHVNDRASQMLHLNRTAVFGQRLTQVLGLPPTVTEAVRQQRLLSDVETGVRVNGHVIQAMINLRPVMESPTTTPFGYVMLLRPASPTNGQSGQSKMKWALDQLPAESVAMKQLLRQLRPAAKGKAPVLLQGEGGVGKNRFAQAIHDDSERAYGPFIAINCRAIPHDMMVDELLGHEKGPDGNGRPSKFELADGGTLMLGQIENLSLEVQATLLHIIETGQVMRIGSTRSIPVDVRIIGTTSANLEQYVTQERFLRSLYYSWSIFNIRIPSLREHVEDIPLLVEQFLAHTNDGLAQTIWIEEEALSVLCRYPWPGNVRELEHALERAVHHSQDGRVTVFDLPEVVRSGRILVTDTPQPQPLLSTAEAEREAIMQVGFACQGNISEMVAYLGISRTTLWRKMKQFNITADYFKK